ncbi:uncharacterized protein LAESUDRAFT_68367 [Laetiporus sulphureus 93-53]|uniref:F-box domain-containing protein n=1 Tax=Laetiporus sulphureus 93-53 TaxID=1314785 RepID=A0A165F5X9_9APHY|nr:uncharacterized protein LAESUDRAFT_68367 [Laetiporus sulphureus 93-53]KZT08453.1 hypothetical protein LAESUDRAFT_68367 [Laetiporus sulphureus 93-53]
MSLATLNADVLTEIVSLLSTKEAFRLSLTNKQVNTVAMQRVYRIIDLKWPRHVKQMCRVLLQEPAKRLVFVRELRISSIALEGANNATVARIVELLSHPFSAHIQRLTLGCIERLLEEHPSCADAVAALPALTQLELGDAYESSLAMIERLTSKPRRLALQFDLPFLEGDSIPTLFSEASGTPTEISESSTTSHEMTMHHPLPDPRLQWFSLHHLFLKKCNLPMSVFVLAFPNVKRICLRQVTSSLPSKNNGVCWPRLDCLDMGDVTYRHPWKVTCPVRHLVLGISRAVGSPKSALSLVKMTMPIVLELETSLKLSTRFWDKLARVGKRLRYLIIVLKKADTVSSSGDYAQNLNHWKSQLPAFMSKLNVSCIRICYPSSLPVAQDILEDVPQILMRSIPSLCYVALDRHHSSERSIWYEGQYDGYQSESTWWRITRIGTRDWEGLARMTTELGEKIDAHMKSDEVESSLPC